MKDFLFQSCITAAAVFAVAMAAAAIQSRHSIAGAAIAGATRSTQPLTASCGLEK